MFFWKLDRKIMDFINDEEELLITFDKDAVEDAHIGVSESTPLINISYTTDLNELEAFINKEYDEYRQICNTFIYIKINVVQRSSFPHKSEKIKNFNKSFYQKTDNSVEILQEHVNKSSNAYDVIK